MPDMPDEHDQGVDEGPLTESTDPTGGSQPPQTSESIARLSTGGNDTVDAPEQSSTRSRRPLITAVEIENFKGIGRPMRIDLRPITLLFGNNSAGKSTVLHALCYAHEILAHRNVDVHKTDLGGDRIDLGGFRNFVHAHDSTRAVRLRFELNLEDWRIPQELDEKLASPLDAMGGDADWDLFRRPSERPRSGWIELQAALRDEQPVLSNYELGVDGALVGSLLPREPTGVCLEFDPTHPLLKRPLSRRRRATWAKPAQGTGAAQPDPRADRVREATGGDGGGSKVFRMEVLGLFSPLPHWNEILLLDDHGRSDADGYDLDVFTTMVNALFVGIGQALRDELARVRYIGPVRDIHPQTSIASSARHRAFEAVATDFISGGATFARRASHLASWSDGSAAWTYLHTSPHREMVEDVSDWLAQETRLDTGYALRMRSRVTLYEDEARLASEMREYHQLRKTFGNAEGSVDLAGWARAEAKAIVNKADPHYRQAALQYCERLRAMFASAADGTSIIKAVDDLTRNALQTALELLEVGGVDIKPGISKEAARNHGLAEDLRLLLTLSVKDIESQIVGSDKDLAASPETLTPAHCRRLNDLLPKWERDAPKRIYLAGIVDGLRAISDRGDFRKEVEEWKRQVEEAWDRNDGSVEVERTLAEFRKAVEATVASASRNYRRVTALVTKMESGNFPSGEIQELATAIATRSARPEIELVTTKNELPVRVADVGVGISQVLPVVVAALDPQRPGITAIEQPELHLHPRLQVELGDLFAQPVDDGRVFLLENHSEHLMLRLLRRIEETHSGELPEGKPPLRQDQVSVVFVEQIDGEVRVTPLRIDENGEFIDRWPRGFFRERAAELF